MGNLNPVECDQIIIKSESPLRTLRPGDVNVNTPYDISDNDHLTNPEKQVKERFSGYHQSCHSPLNYRSYLYKDRDPIHQTRATVTQPEWIPSGVTQKCEFPNKYGVDQKHGELSDCFKDLDAKVVEGPGSSLTFQQGEHKKLDINNSGERCIRKLPVAGLNLAQESPSDKSAAMNYQGWVATESILYSNVHAKTTLERLAAFRYNSCPLNEENRMNNMQQIPTNLGLLAEKEIISRILTPDGKYLSTPIPANPETQQRYFSEEPCDDSRINNVLSSYQSQEPIFIAGEKCRQSKLRRHDVDPSNLSRASENCYLAKDKFESLNESDIELCYLTPAPSSTKTGKFCVSAEKNHPSACGQEKGPKPNPCKGLREISIKNDEYSEGINDLDLLSSFPDLPATVNGCEFRESEKKKICSFNRSLHVTTSFNDSKGEVISTKLLGSSQPINNEDEFPIDADLEKELFQLQSPMNDSLRIYEDVKKRRKFSDINPKFTSNLSAKRPRNTDFDSNILRENFISNSYSQGQKEQTQSLSIYEESGINSIVGGLTFKNDKVSPENSVSYSSRNEIDKATHHPPFARKNFPTLVGDGNPIKGLSSGSFLRVCFRIGELFREAGRCHKLNQAPVMELFARIRSSCQELGTKRQMFHFADIWHDRPPHPIGLLLDDTSSSLLDGSEKKIENINKALVRVLGILKKDNKQASGWLLYIINIRKTDWQEINKTRRIIDAEVDKSVCERKTVA